MLFPLLGSSVSVYESDKNPNLFPNIFLFLNIRPVFKGNLVSHNSSQLKTRRRDFSGLVSQ